jgi:hypothetical protein
MSVLEQKKHVAHTGMPFTMCSHSFFEQNFFWQFFWNRDDKTLIHRSKKKGKKQSEKIKSVWKDLHSKKIPKQI